VQKHQNTRQNGLLLKRNRKLAMQIELREQKIGLFKGGKSLPSSGCFKASKKRTFEKCLG
jgi:hypothetical protein